MTTKKILSTFLTIWCLAQCCLARPSSSNEDYLKAHDLCHQQHQYAVMAPAEKDSKLPASVQLLKITLYALQDITLTYAIKAKTVSEHMLKDHALKENHTNEVEEFLKKLQQFIEKYSTCNDMQELFKLVEFYSTFTSDYYEMEEEKTLSSDAQIILDVLKKYGSQDMDDEFEKSFNEFVTNFSKKFNELENHLKSEKGTDKIVQWWYRAKNLKTYDEKMEAFAEFVKFYEDN
ncbi:hypothetical protein FF38_12685 [Lucilia cuprina]|uniref:Uncharacterized protein n=1 Tax=Lucilia cuprina TaxID=7375 RepID=A0A0L0C495_LUCCU|nr:hypothetical protein CVS40_7836 [Lucilia cuprina]KNC27110.1 hypothetical protein FF38_12685 [Lucilia cuprina]